MLTKLQTPTGPAYVDLTSVVMVSAPFSKKGEELRAVVLQNGAKAYVSDTESNWLILLGAAEASALSQTEPPQRPPARKRRQKAAEE